MRSESATEPCADREDERGPACQKGPLSALRAHTKVPKKPIYCGKREGCLTAPGGARTVPRERLHTRRMPEVRSRRRFARLFIHVTPDIQRDSVPLILRRWHGRALRVPLHARRVKRGEPAAVGARTVRA